MKLIETDSFSTVENVVTHTTTFEHNGIQGWYSEIIDEGNGGMFVSSEFHHDGVDGYLLGGDWKITGELDDSLKEGLNELLNAGIQVGLCAMYRYELKVNDITNLETLPSRLSNFISSVLTTVRDNSKFNINEFKIIFDNELCVIDVYSTKDFEELIPKFQLFSTDKKYSKVDYNDDKYFMPMKAKYDLHLNLSSVRLISKLIKDFYTEYTGLLQYISISNSYYS